jgi:hypothetical protein
MILGSRFTSGKVEELARLTKLFQEIAISIQKMTAINMISLKNLQSGQTTQLD